MSTDLTAIIKGVKKNELELVWPKKVEWLEKVNGKSFAELLEVDMEALQHQAQKCTWNNLEDGKEYNQMIFTNEEIKEAAKVVPGVRWIPLGKGKWGDVISDEGQAALLRNKKVVAAMTEVWEIPAIDGINYSTNQIYKLDRKKLHRVPASNAYCKWHASPSKESKSKTKTGNSHDVALAEFAEKLEAAVAAKDEKLAASYQLVIDSLISQNKASKRHGNKAKA